ncbi:MULTISPECIES: DUF1489 family protein [Commensalibacter]|uniref:DUF1489 family protein n=1 Tax=Commensalibacter TaxID=1079922 RepID=UPI0012D8FC36|nr:MULTISPECIES: DUF1489 domain-containing protein [Commensalibacter]MCT6842594.1 DUF1489 domain-containing protein [Commensalibacter sp.]MBH9970464.1 DUF1489 domain-containing protein [Commensalibacter sp. M0265]MBH9977841.1 DUF1489 domain-containing protein [Commensalibacter sp. M0266]MBH9993499.1 DUF1489 domain-containing protein [Commensalibacter sp. M0270]MBI0046995.1 DUF1489 domain-containing protein [Commensalibacter sp. M0267]
MMKVAVGIQDIAHLKIINEQMAVNNNGNSYTLTRFMPKQADEILKNGSLYRVINGTLCCRQKIVDFLPGQRENGNPCIQIILDSEIIRTFSIPIRPFQGWRYLKNTDAPKDLPLSHTNISAELPKKLRKELETLGLIDPIR